MKRNKYPLTDLVKRWEREELTVEQAVGQILLWLIFMSKQIARLEAKLRGGDAESKSS